MLFVTCLVGDDPLPPEETIEGAIVESESQARRLAMDSYLIKMQGDISATDMIFDPVIILLGYNIEDFADRGIKLWEARVTDHGETRAIIWINPFTEEVYFVCGPWDVEDS